MKLVNFFGFIAIGAALPAFAGNLITGGSGQSGNVPSRYAVTVLVSNNPAYKPQILDPLLIDAWGVSLRPAGAGGHWWINNAGTGTVTEYVGDVSGTPLFQDALRVVNIANSPDTPEAIPQPTGVIFSSSNTDFIVSHDNGVVGPSRFIFCTVDGTVSGWSEQQQPDGSFLRDDESVLTIDNALAGHRYFGCAATSAASANRLYVADFGLSSPGVKVFDAQWQPVSVPADRFMVPGLSAHYAPWNIQSIDGHLFVAYALQTAIDAEESACKSCGVIAEFDTEGVLIARWDDRGMLNAPWGFAIAPADFGDMSNKLLVSNFGDGTIVAFDRTTKTATSYLLGRNGKRVRIGGIWGMTFGNGASLGETNHLYFGAGPSAETEGIFGKLSLIQ